MLLCSRVNCERVGLTNKTSKMFLTKMSDDLKLVCAHGGEFQTFAVKIELETTRDLKPTYVSLTHRENMYVNQIGIRLSQGRSSLTNHVTQTWRLNTKKAEANHCVGFWRICDRDLASRLESLWVTAREKSNLYFSGHDTPKGAFWFWSWFWHSDTWTVYLISNWDLTALLNFCNCWKLDQLVVESSWDRIGCRVAKQTSDPTFGEFSRKHSYIIKFS